MVWVENVVDIVGMAEQIDICAWDARVAFASLAVQNSHYTLVLACGSVAAAVVVDESVDRNHLMDAISIEHYAYVASHSPLDRPFVAPNQMK